MTASWGPWSGGFTAPDGSNVYPYKVEGRVLHSPMDHTSAEVNREVA